MASVINWSDEVRLGRCVIAIGVFDGLHAGHRVLLQAARREADTRGVHAVAVTFDHDPEEILKPAESPAHLMDGATRISTLAESGPDMVLVLPSDASILSLPPARFLSTVLQPVLKAEAIHVGEDFRFGAGAAGGLDDLYVWAAEIGADVWPHPLLVAEDSPVSSTRIRSLIARGDVRPAMELLGRPHAVRGLVHPGRGQGAALGFPTANLTPAPAVVLPADGVYAARVTLPDGAQWPAAVSVGLPPTFPGAVDRFEAHLIGFDGDLNGLEISVGFIERIRDLRPFGSMYALTQAIDADVRAAADVVGLAPAGHAAYLDDDGNPFVDDPLALEAAERAVASLGDPDEASYSRYDSSWVAAYGPVRLSSLLRDGGLSSALITGPLTAAGIPFVWEPFPPAAAQSARPDFNWHREFSLLVAPDDLSRAHDILAPIMPRASRNTP